MKHPVLVLILALLITLSAPMSQPAPANPPATETLAQTSIASITTTPVTTIESTGINVAPETTAASVVLMDAKTGEVLWKKNANQKRAMASTTKIMTGIIAIEQGNLEDTVTVRESAIGPGRFHGIQLVENEQIKLRELLYAALVYSGNDAATAIADHIGGSVDSFADMMNAKAVALGAVDTHFTNPHGLDNPMHYSTARDLAVIARYTLHNSTFAQITGTKTWRVARSDPQRRSKITTTNKLLFSYPGATGGKTGYTGKAKNCLVSSATRGDVSLISVVLGADNRATLFNESKAMLDFGFSLYESKKLIYKDTTYATTTSRYGQPVELVAANDAVATVKDYAPVSIETWRASEVDVPLKKGAVLGKVVAYQDGRAVATTDLVAKEDVAKPTLEQFMSYYWAKSITVIAVGI